MVWPVSGTDAVKWRGERKDRNVTHLETEAQITYGSLFNKQNMYFDS